MARCNNDSGKLNKHPATSKTEAPRQKRGGKNKSPQALVLVPRTAPRAGRPPKPSSARLKFLRAYEETGANVTASCEFANIGRRTYYRWINSETAINKRFKMLLNLTKPTERTIDLLHANFIRRIEEGSDTLIKFGLERLDPRFVARKTYK